MAAKRTKSGAPSVAARKQHGMAGGRFPVFDAKSARSALKLRGHAKGKQRSAVVSKVSRFASKTNNAPLKAAVKRARAVDRKR